MEFVRASTRRHISTPRKHPVILIFTSDAGEQHRYKDEYRGDGIFWHTGKGQIDDMKMVSGNKAILNHNKNSNKQRGLCPFTENKLQSLITRKRL